MVVDSNRHDWEFQFSRQYAAGERQVAALTLPGMPATSVST